MHTAYLLLGSNIGEREAFLSQALKLFENGSGKIIQKSSFYNTAPWPAQDNDQGDFLNQAVCVKTSLSPHELLENILHIEKQLGRIRIQKWEARIIDIDILFYDSEIITTPDLVIPHPFLHQRKFALAPLVEIAGDFIHPVLKKSIKTLLSDNTDSLAVASIKNG